MGACAILPRIIGHGRAAELLFTGRAMSANEGLAWGFFSRICDDVQAEAKALMDGDVRKYGSKTVVAIFDEYYRYFQPFEGLDFLKAMADRNRFIRAWTTFMADYPLVLTPFLPAPIFTWNRDEQGAEGVREVLGSALYSYAMNFMGLPAAVVPANENDGQPVGVQIVGRRFREDMILDAAEAVERSVGVMAERLWRR